MAVVSALLVAGCRTSTEEQGALLSMEETLWTLKELRGSPVTVPANEMKPVTLTMEAKEKRAAGLGGVNRYRGTYVVDGAELKFSPFISTRMAGPPAAMAFEQAYLAALEEVNGWRVRGRTLELLAEGKVVARFEGELPVAPAPANESK